MSESTRIDKWLWHARFYRSRSLAQQAAMSGLVRLNGSRVQKAGTGVKPGDIVTVPKGSEIVAVRVLAIAVRRGPAPIARTLYEIVADRGLDRNAVGP